MSNITDFLLSKEELAPEVKEINFKKFKSPWKIKSITEKENASIRKSCTIKKKNRQGQSSNEFDNERYMSALVAKCVVEPDLYNAQLQEHYGSQGNPALAVQEMLTSGEYALLMEAIQEINDFDADLDVNEAKEEVKK